jgi:transcriptional regulator with XRE-family HTH domain
MLSPDELGRRIKKVRESRNMTLKKVEALAGVSATHVSEIERGKTSPTVGALIKIADALGKDPAYFIEEDELGDLSFVALEDRVEVSDSTLHGTFQKLTRGIPGGRLSARRIRLEPGVHRDVPMRELDGDAAAVVLRGKVLFEVDGVEHVLEEGDSIYCLARLEHRFGNAQEGQEAELFWVTTVRDEP